MSREEWTENSYPPNYKTKLQSNPNTKINNITNTNHRNISLTTTRTRICNENHINSYANFQTKRTGVFMMQTFLMLMKF